MNLYHTNLRRWNFEVLIDCIFFIIRVSPFIRPIKIAYIVNLSILEFSSRFQTWHDLLKY